MRGYDLSRFGRFFIAHGIKGSAVHYCMGIYSGIVYKLPLQKKRKTISLQVSKFTTKKDQINLFPSQCKLTKSGALKNCVQFMALTKILNMSISAKI
jgi:hypothetical protein